jgi:hypothetical protein
MSDPYLNCDLCGDQCACRAFREEHDRYKAALEEIREEIMKSDFVMQPVGPLMLIVNKALEIGKEIRS